MNKIISDSTVIWVLEDDQECKFVYDQILAYRYKAVYFETISDFKQRLVSLPDGEKPSLIIADLLLKDGNFLHFLSEDTSENTFDIPFIVVSSVDDIDALRFCFAEGALDYLTKPFKKNELVVKVENALTQKYSRSIIDSDGKSLLVDGVKITGLTSKQSHLLSLFLANPERFVARNEIIEKVWNDTVVHPKTVDVHLYNLRRKIHPFGFFIRSEGGGLWSLRYEKK